MTDLFREQAKEWDQRPIPQQISDAVVRAVRDAIPLHPDTVLLDFGAGTGLLASKLAPHVARVIAVDVSEAMLTQLATKPELQGKVEIVCRDLVQAPFDATRDRSVDVVVSAMAMHHVADTRTLLARLHASLRRGGRLAIADLDAEDGSFHPPGVEGVFHTGFDRDAVRALLEEVGFSEVRFVTACEVHKEERAYPVFLVTAIA
ncbi:MAG: class I SAM-dependent methyltransferase [Myxococcota bacterium]|jgi:2-polyprenyl-3-methyl-5-hydroxy-6-metoxy-1,4-benzoquinol methylase|nr:class I SAM-dependent methyltransferase [Myxococcota bacterium]